MFFIEEIIIDGEQPSFEIIEHDSKVFVCVPHIPNKIEPDLHDEVVVRLIADLLVRYDLKSMSSGFTRR